ncbi:MAG: rhomboid family intramembrane serine protease [Solitalea-like symbiont of Acarus siro]
MGVIRNSLNFLSNIKGRRLLIGINVLAYIIFKILYIVFYTFDNIILFYNIQYKLGLPLYYKYVLNQPWSILTYSFVQDNLLELIVTVSIINIFGKIIEEYIGKKKLFICYIVSSMFSAIILLIIYNLFEQLQKSIIIINIIGAQQACACLIIASAKLLPNYKLQIFPFKNLSVKIVAIIIFIGYFIFINELKPEYLILNVSAAMLGYLFISYLQNR